MAAKVSSGLTIGRIELSAPFFQGALSGYSDRAMRHLARRFGAPMTMPGVMLDTTTVNPTVIRKGMVAIGDDEHPIGGQIMGATPEVMAQAAQVLEEHGYDLIDLNFACPVPKVLRRQRGGHLLTEPERLLAIVRQVRQAVSCPVTLKLRVGFDDGAGSVEDFWQVCQGAVAEGVDALAVHGRTVEQRYRGFPDWQFLKEIKQRFGETTVIGSGNLFSAKAVVQRLQQSGVDGALIARGAIGNPWIFREVRALLAGETPPPSPTISEQGEVILEHFEMMTEDYRIEKVIGMFRKFLVRYARRHPERNQVQAELMATESEADFRAAMHRWYGVG